MKKLFVVLSLVLATSFVAFAQRPVAGTKGFTFGLENVFQNASSTITNNGPARTGTLLFRYYIADDLAARVSIGYSKTGTSSLDTANATAGAGEEIETKQTNSTFSIQLGAQKSLGEGEKLEPYVAADLYFAKTGAKYFERQETVDVSGGGTVGDFTEIEAKGIATFPGYTGPSTSFGIIPAVGFNYYFTENFAIGAEFGWGLVKTTSSKNVEETTTQKVGATTTTTQAWFNTTQKQSTFDTRGNGTISVSVLF